MASHKVILVGVGGATCSGKTTLAKYLREILPNSFIIHQDDFAPPQEKIPIHPIYNIQDWDSPQGCIEWDRMVSSLSIVKATGEIPPDHRSHDHLNEQKLVPVKDKVLERWKSIFRGVEQQYTRVGVRVTWGLVDGFLLYWNMDVVEQLDVRIFLRAPYEVLRQRRMERHGYHTAVQSDPEGSLWRDPPEYWEQIVWPAYKEANSHLFCDADLDHGQPNDKVAGLVVVDSVSMNMDDILDRVCARLWALPIENPE